MRDFEIREILRKGHLKGYFNDPHSRVVEELSLPTTNARVDMAVINGHLHAYEIKGASDTLARLPGQLQAYDKIFDYITVVTEERYKEKIIAISEPWVGIMVCDSSGKQKLIRKAKRNLKRDSFSIAKLLWNEELLEILSSLKIKHRKKDRNWLLCECLSQSITIEQLSVIVRERLKARQQWKIKELNEVG